MSAPAWSDQRYCEPYAGEDGGVNGQCKNCNGEPVRSAKVDALFGSIPEFWILTWGENVSDQGYLPPISWVILPERSSDPMCVSVPDGVFR